MMIILKLVSQRIVKPWVNAFSIAKMIPAVKLRVLQRSRTNILNALARSVYKIRICPMLV